MEPKNLKEVQREAAKVNAVDIKRYRAFEAMLKTEGWGFYVELLNYHVNERMKGYLQPTEPGGRDKEQHNKGTVFGLLLARDIPSNTVASMKEVVAALNSQGVEIAEEDAA